MAEQQDLWYQLRAQPREKAGNQVRGKFACQVPAPRRRPNRGRFAPVAGLAGGTNPGDTCSEPSTGSRQRTEKSRKGQYPAEPGELAVGRPRGHKPVVLHQIQLGDQTRGRMRPVSGRAQLRAWARVQVPVFGQVWDQVRRQAKSQVREETRGQQ